MGMYLDADITLKLKDTPVARKVVCDTILSSYHNDLETLMDEFKVSTVDDLCKTAKIEELLETEFIIDSIDRNEDGNNEYNASYNDDCSYSFSEEIEKMFKQLAPYMDDDSCLEMSSNDDGPWYESYTVKNHEIIEGSRHDFYIDDSGEPSDDEIADAIIKAAERLRADPDSKNGLHEKLLHVASLKNIIDVLLDQ